MKKNLLLGITLLALVASSFVQAMQAPKPSSIFNHGGTVIFITSGSSLKSLTGHYLAPGEHFKFPANIGVITVSTQQGTTQFIRNPNGFSVGKPTWDRSKQQITMSAEQQTAREIFIRVDPDGSIKLETIQ